MPACPLSFRAICGCFTPVLIMFLDLRARRKASMRMRTLALKTRTSGVVWGLVLTYLYWGSLLYQCGDVELNPGPPTKDTSAMRQTRLTSASARRTSSDRASAVSDSFSSSTQQTGEPTLRDVMCALTNLNIRFDELQGSLSDIRNTQAALQSEMQELRDQVSDLTLKNEALQSVNDGLVKKVDDMEKKTDDLEGRSKRNNLIIYGIEKTGDETWEDCEGVVQDMFTDKLELSQDVQFDRVHRLNSKANSPIVARCTFYKDKVKVLQAKKKLMGSNVFIGEDYTTRVREIRKKLVPHLKKARSEGKRVTMVFDHLVIEGRKYFLNDKGEITVSA